MHPYPAYTYRLSYAIVIFIADVAVAAASVIVMNAVVVPAVVTYVSAAVSFVMSG